MGITKMEPLPQALLDCEVERATGEAIRVAEIVGGQATLLLFERVQSDLQIRQRRGRLIVSCKCRITAGRRRGTTIDGSLECLELSFQAIYGIGEIAIARLS